jgi:hypothetical protein
MDDGGGSNLEIVIDRILFSARDLKRKLDSVRDNNNRLNGESRQVDYKALQKIRDLEKENNELRQALEDHQYGLEFIMSKYRSQVFELIQLNRAEQARTTQPETISLKRNNSVD